MIRNRIPCFKRGEILDSQLLENLRNTPYEFYSLAYHDYPNGIISGLDIYADKSKLTIKPGVVKFNNFYYRISKEEIIDIPLEDSLSAASIYDGKIIKNIENTNLVKFIRVEWI